MYDSNHIAIMQTIISLQDKHHKNGKYRIILLKYQTRSYQKLKKKIMNNNLSFNRLFSKTVLPLERINLVTPVSTINRLVQLITMIAALIGVSRILFLSNSLVYTLKPSVWHWGFDSTIIWQNSSINWQNFTFLICSLFLVLGGLTLFQVTYNYKKQLNRFNNELRPRFISSEQSNIRNIKILK